MTGGLSGTALAVAAARSSQTTDPHPNIPLGVLNLFATRSPDRPDPIGLRLVHILEITGMRIHVRGLEAIDGTPIPDIKPLPRRDR